MLGRQTMCSLIPLHVLSMESFVLKSDYVIHWSYCDYCSGVPNKKFLLKSKHTFLQLLMGIYSTKFILIIYNMLENVQNKRLLPNANGFEAN